MISISEVDGAVISARSQDVALFAHDHLRERIVHLVGLGVRSNGAAAVHSQMHLDIIRVET